MIEKAARALCKLDKTDPDEMASELAPNTSGYGFHFVEVPAWTKRTKEARAVIKAMEKPTDEVVAALELVPDGWGRGSWHNGIEAALANG